MSEITDERIVSYIHSLEKSNGSLLDDMEKYAHDTDVPIIRKEVESFLRTLITIRKPKRILEVGTAIAYSTIIMANVMDDYMKDWKIVTIENYPPRIEEASKNIKLSGFKNIELIEGDANEVLKKLADDNNEFDFIFIDAAKGQYMQYFQQADRMVTFNGIILSDNVLQEGDIVESRFAVERRNRTIHSRMREFLYEIKNRKDYESSIIPIGDGMMLNCKK
ncbi:MAG: O-methyltransferase [Lachnospiraceae bacterium]|nr:O-methyltransferase [Lachnospiraceae bacterium]